jgi:hypothetical protein
MTERLYFLHVIEVEAVWAAERKKYSRSTNAPQPKIQKIVNNPQTLQHFTTDLMITLVLIIMKMSNELPMLFEHQELVHIFQMNI